MTPQLSRRPIGFGPRPLTGTFFGRPSTRRIARSALRPILWALGVSAVLIALVGLGLHASDSFAPSLMSRGAERDARAALEAARDAALASCRAMQGHAADVCKAQAGGEYRVGRADLEALYRGTVAAADKARLARTQASYEVATAKCGILAAEDRVACRLAARSSRVAETLAAAAPATR